MKIDRKAVYDKYGGRCAYCGREITMKSMQVDHRLPKSIYEAPATMGLIDGLDSIDDFDNLMPSCRRCNQYKSTMSVEAFRKQIETIPQKLGKREFIYKVGIDYGFYDDKPRKVTFYFETL